MNSPASDVRLESNDFPCDHLQIHRVTGREGISRLFSFTIELVALEPAELDPAAVAGARATLIIEQDGAVLRTVHGMISEVEDLLDSETAFKSYRLVLVPRAFRLTQVETQEIFLDLSVPDIIKQKLELVGFFPGDFELRLAGTYPPREFVVQYKETDLAFLSRLTEHLGISFFFEQDDDHDRIVFTDHPGGFHPLPGSDAVPFRARGEARDVHEISQTTRVHPACYVMQDYNYRTPGVDLTMTHQAETGLAGGVVEYGAHFKTPVEGMALARIRAEERASAHRFFTGKSDRRAFTAGARFTLEGHPRLHDAALLLVEVEHRAVQVVAGHGGAEGEPVYTNSFRAVDARLPYRPPRVTPRPRIHGVVTGVVEPPADGGVAKYADIDDQGRYTIKFYFDTAPAEQRLRSSRPIRMAQSHAGPNYGIHFPLHPGVEVLVTFIDGDPDRPIIQGTVPNPVTPSPVTRKNVLHSRIQTASGVYMVMKDR